MLENNNSYNSLLNKIKNVSNKQNSIDFATGIINLISVFLVISFFATIIEYFAEGDIQFRTYLFAISIFMIIVSAGFLLNKPLLKLLNIKYKFDIDHYALKVGNAFPEIKDRLLNVLQLSPIKISGENSSSNSDLADSAFKIVFEQSKDKDFGVVIDKSKLKRSSVYFIIASLLNISLFSIFPSEMFGSLNRTINYKQSYLPAIPFSLELENERYSFLRGEDIAINILGKGQLPKEIIIKMKEKGQQEFDEFTSKFIDGKYTFIVNSIKNNFEFFAEANYYQQITQTKIGKVEVTDLPIIKKISGSISLPYYTNQPSYLIDESNADITALIGSKFSFTISSNKNLKSAQLIFKPALYNDTNIVKKSLNLDGNSAKGEYKITENGEYYFEVIDENLKKSIQPIVYRIIALSDESPEIKLINPSENITLSEKAILPILTQISDDYGFSKLILNYRLSASSYVQVDDKFQNFEVSIIKNELIQEVPYVWDLNRLNIVPENEYEFYLEIFDNDIVSGPKSSRTQIITLRLPSLDEVFAQSEQTQEEVIKEMGEIVKDTEKLKKDIEDLENEMRKDANKKKLDWEKQKKAKDIAQKQEQLKDKFSEMQQKLEESTEKLQDNNVLSPETLEKYKELQELMKEVSTEEMKQKSQKINEELEKMSPEEMKKALENMKLDEEQFKKQIERTMKLLKKLQMEQKMDMLSKKAKDMEKQQEKLSNELDKKGANKEELSKKQDKLKEDVNKLEKDLANLGEDLKELEDKQLMEEFQKSLESLNPENTKEQMNQANENMKQNKKEQAKRNQQNAQKNLDKFAQQMQKMKQQMQQNQMQKAIDQMQKSISDMVDLSKQQEELRKKLQKLDHNSTQLPEIQKEQGQIKQSLNNISEGMENLSQQMMQLSPNIAKEMANAMKEMKKAEEELSERRTNSSSNAQRNAMESLNNSSNDMQGVLSDMKGQQAGACQNPGGGGEGEGSGQGTGQGQEPSLSQQIQQAAAQQQMLQESLQEAMQNQGGASGGKDGKNKDGKEGKDGNKTDGQSGDKGEGKNKQGMEGRLKDQIGEAQKSIEKLKEEQKKYQNEQGEKMAAELKEVSEQMKEILADVESGRISDKTLERQQKILSRLLEAYKSVNERDFSKKRKAESGDKKDLVSPDGLQLDEFERKRAMEEMMKKLKLGYSKDYELLIKEYFQDVNKEANQEETQLKNQ